jgi:hypothetical protein
MLRSTTVILSTFGAFIVAAACTREPVSVLSRIGPRFLRTFPPRFPPACPRFSVPLSVVVCLAVVA